jgi:nitrogen regulatory protein P-II 2
MCGGNVILLMKTVRMKRLTIIVENSIEYLVAQDAHELGATGFTYTVVHGQGAKGTRPNRWQGPNAKIEIIATPEVAERIFEHVAKKYFDEYATIAFMDDVEVLRGQKFGA